MKEITIRLYDYDELSDEAKRYALEKHNENSEYPWAGEVRDIIKELEENFNVELRGWEYSSWRSDYGTIHWGDWWTDERRQLAGNRARAFLWNNYHSLLLEPEYHYWTHDRNGKLLKAVAADSRRYESKVFFSRVYDGTCPLTGFCMDGDALDPMAYFVFGVEWNEKEQKRTMVPFDRRKSWEATTVEDIIAGCFSSLFDAIQRDCEWCESEEHFREECAANNWTFEKNGRMRNCA